MMREQVQQLCDVALIIEHMFDIMQIPQEESQ